MLTCCKNFTFCNLKLILSNIQKSHIINLCKLAIPDIPAWDKFSWTFFQNICKPASCLHHLLPLPRTIVVVIVVITVFIACFLYCTFKIYSAVRLSSHKCIINSVCVRIMGQYNWITNICFRITCCRVLATRLSSSNASSCCCNSTANCSSLLTE